MKFNTIITALRKTVQQNYKEINNEEDISEIGVLIINRVLHSRVISNWGRDEDTDEKIYLNENGWVSVTTVGQHGAGPAEIISENKKEVNDEYVYNILNEDRELTINEFLRFVDQLHKINKKYSSEFSSNLYYN